MPNIIGRGFNADRRMHLLPVAGVIGTVLVSGQALQAERSDGRLAQAEAVKAHLQAEDQSVRAELSVGHYRITPERRALLNTI